MRPLRNFISSSQNTRDIKQTYAEISDETVLSDPIKQEPSSKGNEIQSPQIDRAFREHPAVMYEALRLHPYYPDQE